jgi:hypothetical protein
MRTTGRRLCDERTGAGILAAKLGKLLSEVGWQDDDVCLYKTACQAAGRTSQFTPASGAANVSGGGIGKWGVWRHRASAFTAFQQSTYIGN